MQTSVDTVFAALADATRRSLLERIAREQGASASSLAVDAEISRQAIAKHLSVLEAAGLVSRQRRGREICFHVETQQLAATGRWMQRFAKRWATNIDTESNAAPVLSTQVDIETSAPEQPNQSAELNDVSRRLDSQK